MGMYDSVYIECPKCGEQVEFQSKAGECDLTTYNRFTVPANIAMDIEQDIETCRNCNAKVRLHVQTTVILQPYVTLE